jgi:hypothetical protein
MELFQSDESMLALLTQVGNPGLKLANTFGVKSLPRLFVQSLPVLQNLSQAKFP